MLNKNIKNVNPALKKVIKEDLDAILALPYDSRFFDKKDRKLSEIIKYIKDKADKHGGTAYVTSGEIIRKFDLKVTRRNIELLFHRFDKARYWNLSRGHTGVCPFYIITFNPMSSVLKKCEEILTTGAKVATCVKNKMEKIMRESKNSYPNINLLTQIFFSKKKSSLQGNEKQNSKKKEGANMKIEKLKKLKTPKYSREKADKVFEEICAEIEEHTDIPVPRDNKTLKASIITAEKKLGGVDKTTKYLKERIRKGGKIKNIIGLVLFLLSFGEINAYCAKQQLQPPSMQEKTIKNYQQNSAKCENLQKIPIANDCSLVGFIKEKTKRSTQECEQAAHLLSNLKKEADQIEKSIRETLAKIRKTNPIFKINDESTYTKIGSPTEFIEQNLLNSMLPAFSFAKRRYLKIKEDVFSGKWFDEDIVQNQNRDENSEQGCYRILNSKENHVDRQEKNTMNMKNHIASLIGGVIKSNEVNFGDRNERL